MNEMTMKELETYGMYKSLVDTDVVGNITEERFNEILDDEFYYLDSLKQLHRKAERLLEEGKMIDELEYDLDEDDDDLIEAYEAIKDFYKNI